MAWYAAKVRYRAIRRGPAKEDLLEDSVFVFRSDSLLHARRRAGTIAEAMVAERTDVDAKGRRMRWALDRVHDVVEVGPAGLVDGAEVWRDRFDRARKGAAG